MIHDDSECRRDEFFFILFKDGSCDLVVFGRYRKDIAARRPCKGERIHIAIQIEFLGLDVGLEHCIQNIRNLGQHAYG